MKAVKHGEDKGGCLWLYRAILKSFSCFALGLEGCKWCVFLTTTTTTETTETKGNENKGGERKRKRGKEREVVKHEETELPYFPK